MSIALNLWSHAEKVNHILSLDENQLIERARAGDLDSFSLLAERFERRIYTLALFYTRDPHDAEDLSQDVWLKAFKGLHSFRGDASFYTWLRHITVNTFLNHKRAERVRLDDFKGSAPELAQEDSNQGLDFVLNEEPAAVEDEYHRKILADRVMEALGELTPQQRLVFLLKHREGMTYEEIARAFGCSMGTVKKALFRAVTKLRRQFGLDAAPPEIAQCGAARNSLGDSHA